MASSRPISRPLSPPPGRPVPLADKSCQPASRAAKPAAAVRPFRNRGYAAARARASVAVGSPPPPWPAWRRLAALPPRRTHTQLLVAARLLQRHFGLSPVSSCAGRQRAPSFTAPSHSTFHRPFAIAAGDQHRSRVLHGAAWCLSRSHARAHRSPLRCRRRLTHAPPPARPTAAAGMPLRTPCAARPWCAPALPLAPAHRSPHAPCTPLQPHHMREPIHPRSSAHPCTRNRRGVHCRACPPALLRTFPLAGAPGSSCSIAPRRTARRACRPAWRAAPRGCPTAAAPPPCGMGAHRGSALRHQDWITLVLSRRACRSPSRNPRLSVVGLPSPSFCAVGNSTSAPPTHPPTRAPASRPPARGAVAARGSLARLPPDQRCTRAALPLAGAASRFTRRRGRAGRAP